MKKTLSLIALASIGASAILSCQKAAQPETQYVGFPSDEVVFATAGLTKSAGSKATAVTSLDETGFQCEAYTVASSVETSVFNVAFAKDGSVFKATPDAKYWPSTDESYKFYAANQTITPDAAGAYLTIADNNTDVVWASNTAPTYKESNLLTFNHCFARLCKVTINGPDTYTVDSVKIKVTPLVSGKFKLSATDSTGWSNTAAGTETVIASATGTSAGVDLYLVPGEYTLTAVYGLSKDAYHQAFTKTASVKLAMGRTNNITTTLPAGDATEIVFTVTVTDWTDNNITVSDTDWK